MIATSRYDGASVIRYEYRLKALNSEMESLADSDQLTGLANRRFIYRKLNELVCDAAANNQSFTIGMADIDNFKEYNDTYGHLFGDEILKMIGQCSTDALRKCDIVGRWGGKAFLYILPATPLENGKLIMQRVKDRVSAAAVVYNGTPVHVTITIGCAEYTDDISLTELLHTADIQLYRGKRSGKNIVCA